MIRAQAEALGLPHLCIPIDGAGEGGYMGAYQVCKQLSKCVCSKGGQTKTVV